MVLPPSQLRLHFSMKVQGAAAERDKNKNFTMKQISDVVSCLWALFMVSVLE